MPGLTLLALIACVLCVAIGVGMAFVVFCQAPRARENQLMTAYFLVASYGAGEIFLARALSLVGADVAPFFSGSYIASSLALLALLALVTDAAGLWRRSWIPLLLLAVLALVVMVEMPMMHAGRLLRFDGYGADGQLEMRVTALGQLSFLITLPAGVVILAVASRFPRTRGLIPGLTLGVIGPLLHVLSPAWRLLPISVLAAAGSMVLLAHRILRSNLFDPMARLNRDLQAEIEQRGALIGELQAFAGSVAHDLKGPLGPILGAAQILEEEFDETPAAKRQEYTQMIRRNAAAISHIVDSLSLLARLRHLEVVSEPVDMEAVVAGALERLGPEIAEFAAVIEKPSHWPVAVASALLVEEMWVNYISNAIKYGGRPPRIRLEARCDGDVCVFSVSDNGDGLSEEHRDTLFHSSRSDRARGLGLQVVRRIADKLGGAVGVESDGLPGRGCRFSFTLPATASGAIAAESAAPPAKRAPALIASSVRS